MWSEGGGLREGSKVHLRKESNFKRRKEKPSKTVKSIDIQA